MGKMYRFKAEYRDSMNCMYVDRFTVSGNLESHYVWERATEYALREEEHRSVTLVSLKMYDVEEV